MKKRRRMGRGKKKKSKGRMERLKEIYKKKYK
jgi:hypothetical protein